MYALAFILSTFAHNATHTVQTLPTTTITVETKWVCGPKHESMIGGTYRECATFVKDEDGNWTNLNYRPTGR